MRDYFVSHGRILINSGDYPSEDLMGFRTVSPKGQDGKNTCVVSACKHALDLAGPAGKPPDAGTADGYAAVVSDSSRSPKADRQFRVRSAR